MAQEVSLSSKGWSAPGCVSGQGHSVVSAWRVLNCFIIHLIAFVKGLMYFFIVGLHYK